MTVPFPHFIRSTDNDTSYFPGPRLTKREEDGLDSDNTPDLMSTSPRSSILNEITNSGAYRVRAMHKRAPIPVFQDSPKRFATIAGTNSPSVYHDASSDVQSPSVTDSLRGSSGSMGLKEVSINVLRPSPNRDSPHYRSVRAGSRRISSQSKPRFNSEEYIEHIENELQQVKDAMYSPTTNVHWKEKLRKAKDENERLKKEMEMLKSSFELEMHQTVERSTGIEQRLKRRIKDLEDEVEHKQTVILDLEHDRKETGLDQNTLEVLKAKLERLEEEKSSLETTNRDMMKRNEVLTQLLALSPTKTQHNFEYPTPRRRSARPMSMIIPRLPSSPGAQTPLNRPQSVLISPALPASDYFPTSVASSPLASSPRGMVNNYPTAADDVQSIDSGMEDSSSQHTEGTRSRRSTLASCATNSPPMPPTGHPQLEVRPQMPMRQPSKRRPRKFMPGSTQLKPLLLATFTAENGNLPSTSPVTSPNRPTSIIADYGLPYTPQWESPPIPPRRMESLVESQSLEPSHDTSDQATHAYQSLDEVFTKDRGSYCHEALNALSNGRSDHSHPQSPSLQYYTSNQPSHIDGATEVLNDAERLPLLGSWGLGIKPASPGDVHAQYLYDENGNTRDLNDEPSDVRLTQLVPGLGTNRTTPQPENSLGTPEEYVDIPRPLFSKDIALDRGATQPSLHSADDPSPLNPRKRRKASSTFGSSEQEKELSVSDVLPSEAIPRPTLTPSSIIKRSAEAASPQPATSPSRRQGATRSRSPLEILQQRNVGARPLATLTIQTVYATLSRYTSYIRRFKQDPLALARRVIANAWRSNWARLGKLSWWVLGLFIGHRRPSTGQRAWDWEIYDGESIADRHCGFEHGEVSPDECAIPSAGKATKPADDHVGDPTQTDAVSPDTWVPPDKDPKPGWGKSLFLWGKFSVAIMLAVGGAIVKGPAEMLRDTEERRRSRSSSLVGNNADEQISAVRQGGGLHRESRQVLCSGASHSPEKIMALGTTRKARSFSSPTPPAPHYQLQSFISSEDLSATESNTEDANVVPIECAMEADDSTPSVNETLKPTRTERGGLEFLFELPCSEVPNRGSAEESLAIVDVSMDCENG
ncbi:hypothetical protein A1O3_05815 [Capronia epimyces CBS 606.96]|uniref:Uncharacterized protein n=1 Tax=Capronia epimyces CBS 606.96 TaxID=1182542 RepID=W9Y674_9EURO|nr:uncharacterized protein A1O3_05815 [Capronia epimyces CBS 606.96]EXJ85140.1 hypothetical protein A1O3_05815 [Capronia epimyces CBS 606.96]